MPEVKVSAEVLEGLEAVRESGLTNMLDRGEVERIAETMGYGEAATFVREEQEKYAEGVFKGFAVKDQ